MRTLAILFFALSCSMFAAQGPVSLDGKDWKILPPVKTNLFPVPDEKFADPDQPVDNWKMIQVPHASWHVLFPETYPDKCSPNGNYSFTGTPTYVSGWFHRTFFIPDDHQGRIYLQFGAISFLGRIYVNGKFVMEHKGSFTGFEADITKYVKPGKNTLRIWVMNDFGENPPRHVYGKMFSAASNYGGITGGVSLKLTGNVNVKRMLISPRFQEKKVDFELHLRNYDGEDSCSFVLTLTDSNGAHQRFKFPAQTLKVGESILRLQAKLENPIAWSPNTPHLYQVEIEIVNKSGKIVAKAHDRFGFREFKARGKKLYLNEKPIRLYCGNILTSGNWEHFSPESKSVRADLLRQKKSGVNTIRYHMGGMDSHRLLQLADEIGLMVIDEFPMFHRVFSDLIFSRSEQRKEFMDNTIHEWQERILRDHNHPSAVIFVLSNEVWTDSVADELNELYKAIKEVDRQNRPIDTGSGLHSFGTPSIPVNSDVFDPHLYNITSSIPTALGQSDFLRYFDDLRKMYGQEKVNTTPTIVCESMLVGFSHPKKYVPRTQVFTVNEYLAHLGANIKNPLKWYGLRSFLEGKTPSGNELNDAVIKDGFEQFRRCTDFQGYHIWTQRRDIIYPSYSMLLSPLYVGADRLNAHVLLDKGIAFDMLAVDDTCEGGKGILSVSLKDNSGKTIPLPDIPIMIPQGVDLYRTPVKCSLPNGIKTGFYTLTLNLTIGKKKAWNYYDVFISQPSGLSDLAFTGKMAKCDFGSHALDILPLPLIRPEQTMKYTSVIVHVPADRTKDFIKAAPLLADYVRKGGRLMLMNLSPMSLDFLLPGYSVKSGKKTEDSAFFFMEPVHTEHPVMKDLTDRHLQYFNGNLNILGTSLVYPVTENIVAAGFPYNLNGVGMAISDFAVGRGSVLIFQADVLNRLDDPVAEQLFRNAVEYIGGTKSVAIKMQPGKENPALAEYAAIPSAESCPLNLSSIVNRNFKDDKQGIRGWTLTGLPDFRQGPTGDRKLGGVVYHIAEKAGQGRVLIMRGSRTKDCPEAVRLQLPVPVRFSRLVSFHTSWYPPVHGEIWRYIIEYEDGSTSFWPIRIGIETGDWYSPFDRKAAVVACKELNEQVNAPFGFYASIWKNPTPEKKIRAIQIVSKGLGTPIIFALTGINYRDFAFENLGMSWTHEKNDFGTSYAFRTAKSPDTFIMEGAHSWIAPLQNKVLIQGNTWKILRFSIRASAPYRMKLRYMAATGDNGVSEWIKPAYVKNGEDFYELDMSKVRWPHASSPEAKLWGGRNGLIHTFGLDFYAKEGTQITFGPIRLSPF